MKQNIFTILMYTLLMSVFSFNALAASHMASDRISDIRGTKHNFASDDEPQLPSVSGVRTVKAATENQICIFCHTPHGDPAKVGDRKHFLWNRSLNAVASKYDSTSMQTDMSIASPGAGSKMCLSCHDGTVAIGQVDVVNGRLGSEVGNITMSGTDGDGTLISTSNSNLGTDLTNDHPIGFTYDASLAAADKELVDPSTAEGNHIGIRVGSGVATFNASVGGAPTADNPTASVTRIAVPLESVAAYRAVDHDSATYISVAAQGSVECISCHDPHIRSVNNTENIKFLRLHRFQKIDPVDSTFAINSDINCLACHKKAGWAGSAHASETVADNVIGSDETDAREFPAETQVWQASCLSCHDTHTATGASHLLVKNDSVGDSSDLEQTCYTCHGSTSILDAGNEAVDIETVAASNPHAVGVNDQTKHFVRSGDMEESPVDLKSGRHVTCADCHNPHRVVKNSAYDASGISTQATHIHDGSVEHSNIASGSLRGTMGAEPDFTTVAETFSPFDTTLGFQGADVIIPDEAAGSATYQVVMGDVSVNANLNEIVTKEYQVCLKCHSNFGITSAELTAKTKRNLAMEFQPRDDTRTLNHNSWHPVVGETIRIGVVAADNFISPFNQGIGNQTMYCADCHNNDSVGAKGPHGSNNPDLLIAPWSNTTGSTTPNDLCFQCHKFSAYADSTTTIDVSIKSNFSGTLSDNLHITHAEKAVSVGPDAYTCSLCHVNTPHGWKNKGLLVDLATPDAALDPEYYFPNKKLTIVNYKTPGNWEKVDCSSAGCH